jgi:hypothetical protein
LEELRKQQLDGSKWLLAAALEELRKQQLDGSK